MPPYRAARGGAFGGGVAAQEPATLDIGGAIDALMGGTAGLIRQAMLRKEQQRQIARQESQDKLAAEDRTRNIEHQTWERGVRERELATTQADRARKLDIEDAKLRSEGYTPPQTRIVGAMGTPVGQVPVLNRTPGAFNPRKAASYQIEQETDAREHQQDLAMENVRAKNSRIASAMARRETRDAANTPERRDQDAATVAERAVRANGGDPRLAMIWMDENEKALASQLGLNRRHYHEAAARIRAEQGVADQAAALRLQSQLDMDPEEAAATVAATRNATAARPTARAAAPAPSKAAPAKPAPAAPAKAPAGKPAARARADGNEAASRLARAKALLDRIPPGSANRAAAEAAYKRMGGKL